MVQLWEESQGCLGTENTHDLDQILQRRLFKGLYELRTAQVFSQVRNGSEYCTGLEYDAISLRRCSKVAVFFGAGRRSPVK